MRHSFLPTQEQKIFKRVYLTRVLVVTLFLLSGIGLIGIVSLFPAYINIYIEESSQNKTISSSEKNKEVNEVLDIEKKLRRDMSMINSLSQTFFATKNSELVQEIISARGTVLINSIEIQDLSTSTATIILSGTSPTRESLVSFKTRLEILSKGNKIELPISGLAKNKDIPFSLRVIKSIQ